MKKGFFAMVSVMMVFFMLGCSAEKPPAMQLKAAEMTEKEERLLDLLGYQFEGNIFDYIVDDQVKSISVGCYQLNSDGQWEESGSGGNFAIEKPAGRIAITFDTIGDGARVAIQNGEEMTAVENKTLEQINTEGMSKTTAWASSPTDIVYEKEIPLAIQIFTTQKGTVSYSVDYFDRPEEYLSYGYEHVYAVTITFSTNKL